MRKRQISTRFPIILCDIRKLPPIGLIFYDVNRPSRRFMKNDNYCYQEDVDNIANTIESLRLSRHMTINALALESNISENTIKYILKRKSFPTLPVLIKLCSVFDLPLWEFFLIVSGKEKKNQHLSKELLDSFEKLEPKQKDLLLYIAKNLVE